MENKEDADELYNQALEIIKSEGKASTSFLQRKLQIGYNRAARIIDMMEENGIVSKANHVGKRGFVSFVSKKILIFSIITFLPVNVIAKERNEIIKKLKETKFN